MRAFATAGLLALAACSGTSNATPSSPATNPPPTTSPTATPTAISAPTTTGLPASSAGITPQGFASRRARVTAPDGEVCELCVWVADSPDLRARGLMDVTDLGAAEAMAFVYAEPTSTSFWMFSTPMPLSIAFFDAGGAWLDDFEMEPCATPPCAGYATPDDFTIAVEAPAGGLTELLIGPGSTFALLDLPCDRAAAAP